MLKVLIVEDSVMLADLLEDFLVARGYDVCGSARNVAEAVRLADQYRPDLAVVDYRLERGEFGSQIRPLLQDKVTMGILYVSGDPLEEKLTKIDGDAYIQKPYGLSDLCHALEVIRHIKRSEPFETPLPNGMRLLQNYSRDIWQMS